MGSDRKPLVPYRFCLIAEYFKPKIRLYYKRIFKDKIALKELVCEVVDDFTDLNFALFFLFKYALRWFDLQIGLFRNNLIRVISVIME